MVDEQEAEQNPPEEKKIIIDEDWKSQVEAEREASAHGQEEPKPAEDSTTAPLPPASLTLLAGSLYLQGALSLGLLPGPGGEKPEVHLDQAKHTLEMLEMLQEKTEGNRTAAETEEIERMLHELRLAYVSVQGAPK